MTSETTFSNYLLIFYAYSKTPNFYGTERINIEEVMNKLDIFQAILGKIDEFGWWDLEIISADAGTQFTPMEFQEEYQTCAVQLTLADPERQEMNGQSKVTRRTLRTIAH